MLNKFAKLLLVATSLAPIFLTLWFSKFSKEWDITVGCTYLLITIILTSLCVLLLFLSTKNLEKNPIKINSVKTADKEVVGFIIVYLLPLINESTVKINTAVLIFIALLFFWIVFTSNSYHFNPLLGFLGYHFYEITIEGGITYILISRSDIVNCKNIKYVVQLSEYMVLGVKL